MISSEVERLLLRQELMSDLGSGRIRCGAKPVCELNDPPAWISKADS